MGICKFPGKVCSLEAARFGKDDPKDASTEDKTKKKEEDGIFFHGLDLAGCCEGHQLLKHTRVPDLLAIGGPPKVAFGDTLDDRWLEYSAVGGYSAGRKPMIRYVKNNGKKLKYAFVLDPSYPDKVDYGKTILAPWLTGGKDRKLLVIYGAVSKGAIIEEWLGGLRKLDEDIRKSRIVVWQTKEAHVQMKPHIRAMEDPSYQPKGGMPDKDFAESFT